MNVLSLLARHIRLAIILSVCGLHPSLGLAAGKTDLASTEIEARCSPQVAVGGMKIECPELDLCLPMQGP